MWGRPHLQGYHFSINQVVLINANSEKGSRLQSTDSVTYRPIRGTTQRGCDRRLTTAADRVTTITANQAARWWILSEKINQNKSHGREGGGSKSR